MLRVRKTPSPCAVIIARNERNYKKKFIFFEKEQYYAKNNEEMNKLANLAANSTQIRKFSCNLSVLIQGGSGIVDAGTGGKGFVLPVLLPG